MDPPLFRINDSGGSSDYPFGNDRIRVGRAKTNDIVLHGRVDISREHLEIIRKDDRWILHDLDSEFGTFINRQPVKVQELKHGDVISLASFEPPELTFLTEHVPLPETVERPTSERTTQIHEVQIISHIADTFRAIGSRGVLLELLDRIADSAIELSNADRGFILLTDDEKHLTIETARRRGRTTLPVHEREISRVVPQEVYETGKTQVLDLRGTDASAKHGHTVELGISSALCAPLNPIQFYQGELSGERHSARVGVMYLDSRSTIHLRSPVVLPLIEALAEEAAAAIQNVRLLQEAERAAQEQEERRVAGEIQGSLQPPRYRRGDFYEVAGSTVPCEQVGGDFLDFPILDGGNALGLALADVAGKGLPAALLAALTQGTFSGLAQLELSPAKVLSRIDQLIAARENPSRFVTFHYAVLFPDGQLRSCNAGHFAPRVIRENGRVEHLEVGGPPIGIFGDEKFEEETLVLRPGELVVLFSDGMIDALSEDNEFFGEERLQQCMCVHKNKPVEEILACIEDGIREFVRSKPQQDDMTVLIARYLGK
jgi:serine phosphatase RsbU (regulator of sigma subunit)